MRDLACITGLLIIILLGSQSAGADALIEDDFEYFPANSGVHSISPPGGTGAPLSRVWDNVTYGHLSHAIQVVCDGTAASGNCFLVENFLPGKQGASELRDHASQAPTLWTPPTEEVWIRHFVRWPINWVWPNNFSSLKLGRLRLGDQCMPKAPCIETYWGPMHGDPSRLKWTYGFTVNGKDWCCEGNLISGSWPGGFQTNRWYCIELHLRQNTRAIPANGVMEIYVDGKLIVANYGADTRGNSGPGSFALTLLSITDNFVGPKSGPAATEKTPAVHFDGVVFSTTRPGCSRISSPHP